MTLYSDEDGKKTIYSKIEENEKRMSELINRIEMTLDKEIYTLLNEEQQIK